MFILIITIENSAQSDKLFIIFIIKSYMINIFISNNLFLLAGSHLKFLIIFIIFYNCEGLLN